MHQTDTCPPGLLNCGHDFFQGASVASSSIQAAAGGGGGWWVSPPGGRASLRAGHQAAAPSLLGECSEPRGTPMGWVGGGAQWRASERSELARH